MQEDKEKTKEENKQESKLKILVAGDLHGDISASKKLSEKAEKEKVDLVLLLGDIHVQQMSKGLISPFKKANQKVLFVPGNWDTTLETKMLQERYGLRNLDGYYTTYKDVDIIGVGTSDFRLSLDEKKTMDRLKKNFEKSKSRKKILISHLHPAKTKAEFSGFPGSKAVRKAVDYFHPDFVLSAHIHEAEGIEEKIGKTRVINVGKKGKIIEI